MAFIAAQAAPEPSRTATAPPPAATAPAAPARRVCISQPDTGSILPHEVCHTAAEWAAIQREQLNTNRPGPALPGMVMSAPR